MKLISSATRLSWSQDPWFCVTRSLWFCLYRRTVCALSLIYNIASRLSLLKKAPLKSQIEKRLDGSFVIAGAGLLSIQHLEFNPAVLCPSQLVIRHFGRHFLTIGNGDETLRRNPE